jgi:hypothetical protein
VTVTIETNGASVVLASANVAVIEVSVEVRKLVTNEVMRQPLPTVEELVGDIVVEFTYRPKDYEC